MGLLFTRAPATFIHVLARFVYVHQRLAVLYYIYSQGNGTRNRSQRVSKKNKKVLDKRSQLCYNKDVPRGTKKQSDLRLTARERGILWLTL